QRGEQMGLALEAGQPLGIGRKELGQDLDGDVAPELRVARTIHFAHAARAERTDDFVRAEAAARGDGHLLSAAVPFTTTVIVAVGVSSVTRLRRNRCPSRVTSYCWRRPPPDGRSAARKSGTAVPTSSAVSPATD